jgi:hypothetical protein
LQASLQNAAADPPHAAVDRRNAKVCLSFLPHGQDETAGLQIETVSETE